MAELWGWSITRVEPSEKQLDSFVPPENDDGALPVSAGGNVGTYLDIDGSAKTETELVMKYRQMSIQPEMEMAIDEVTNECIVKDGDKPIVQLNLDDLEIDDSIKEAIHQEWKNVESVIDFNVNAYEMFRRFYIDGRLLYNVLIDEENPRLGIQEVRYIDPRKIRKIRVIKKVKDRGAVVTRVADEFYLYNEKGFKGVSAQGMDNTGLRIAKDAVAQVTSGLLDEEGKMVLSWIHKAIKPLNQLRIMEDALLIYRISRAPERRAFYIDTGNLNKAKAEQYVRDMMTKFRNRLVYDAATGTIRDDRKFQTLIEDYWLPRREGGKTTEIQTLPGGQSLGQLDDVLYFQKKLYQSLIVPVSRIDSEQAGGFNLGQSQVISRDELKFQKFVDRLRLRFAGLLLQFLGKQLILKGVITSNDWDMIENKIHFDFSRDNYWAEMMDAEVLRDRLTTLEMIDPFVGKFYSGEWVMKNVLQMTEDDVKQEQAQIQAEVGTPFEFMAQQLIPAQMEAEMEAQMGGGSPRINKSKTKPKAKSKPAAKK